MLPLINNALPSTPSPSQNSTAGASLLAAGSTDTSTAGRQQTTTAVTASPSTAGYFTGTTQQTDANDKNIVRVYVPPPTDNYIDLPPDLQQQQLAQQAAQPARSVPVTLGIPLTTQLNAQFIAQQPAVAAVGDTEAPSSNSDEAPTPAPAVKIKTPSFSSARGTVAYGIAAARSVAVNAQPEIEAA